MAVHLARQALTNYIEKKRIIEQENLSPVFEEKRGVFVTLHEDGDLRGCIGYPQPVMPLERRSWTQPSMLALATRAFPACDRASWVGSRWK